MKKNKRLNEKIGKLTDTYFSSHLRNCVRSLFLGDNDEEKINLYVKKIMSANFAKFGIKNVFALGKKTKLMKVLGIVHCCKNLLYQSCIIKICII